VIRMFSVGATAALAALLASSAECRPETAAVPGWRYSEIHDRMRGTTSVLACIRASTHLLLSAPYRSQAPDLCISGDNSHQDVYLKLPFGGQFLTHEGAELSLDDGAVQSFSTVGAADDSNDTIFFDMNYAEVERHMTASAAFDQSEGMKNANAEERAKRLTDWENAYAATTPTLADEIAAAKKMIVEVHLFQNGVQQVSFDVHGLHWPPAVKVP
jgi:hypothetical protein